MKGIKMFGEKTQKGGNGILKGCRTAGKEEGGVSNK